MSDIVDRSRFYSGWKGGNQETKCGFGSTLYATKTQRGWLSDVVFQYGIKTVADIGAGDLNWISHMDWDVDYKGYDLVVRHPDVIEFDIVSEQAPAVDCLLCLWVLNHLPIADSQAAIHNLRTSGSKYLIMTDRPKYHHEQPPEIHMDYLEELILNAKGDRILLVEL